MHQRRSLRTWQLLLIVGCLNFLNHALGSNSSRQLRAGPVSNETQRDCCRDTSINDLTLIKNHTSEAQAKLEMTKSKEISSTGSPDRFRRHLSLLETRTTTKNNQPDDPDFEQFIEVAPNVQTSARNNHLLAVRLSSSPASNQLTTTTTTTSTLEVDSVQANQSNQTDPRNSSKQHKKKTKSYLKSRANSAAYISTRQLNTQPMKGEMSKEQQPPPNVQSITSPATQNDDYLSRIYLDTSSMLLNVKAHLGETAYLLCRLRSNQPHQHQHQQQHHHHHAGQELPLQVSWVKNMQILTSGEFRYTSDERFRPTHLASNWQDWILEIHNVQASDEGQYECQVNSEPKPASIRLNLQVISAQVEILEPPVVGVDYGDEIKLTCRVEFKSQAQLQREAAGATAAAAAAANDHHLSLLDPYGQDEQQLNLLLSSEQQQQQQTDLIGDNQNDNNESQRKRRWMLAARSAVVNNWQHYLYWYKDGVSLEYNNPRGNVQVQRRDLKVEEEEGEGEEGGEEQQQQQQQQRESTGLESILRLGRANGQDQGFYMCKLLPELLDVQPARVQVLVGSSKSSGSRGWASMSLVTSLLSTSPIRWCCYFAWIVLNSYWLLD